MVTAQRELDPEEFTALVRDLARADLPGLPPNLYQDQYTDVVVKVLNRRAQINARRFAGMTAETHGSKQERFDTVLEQLRALQRRLRAGSAQTGSDAGARLQQLSRHARRPARLLAAGIGRGLAARRSSVARRCRQSTLVLHRTGAFRG